MRKVLLRAPESEAQWHLWENGSCGSTASAKWQSSGHSTERFSGTKVASLMQSRTEAPQLVSKEDILWSMDAMQLREVGNFAVQLWKMRWLPGLCWLIADLTCA